MEQMDSQKIIYPRIINVIRLPPLPGSIQWQSEKSVSAFLNQLGIQLIQSCQQWMECGIDGFLLSNHGDKPYFKNQVPTITLTSLGLLGAVLKSVLKVSLGLELQENDSQSSLCVAAVGNLDWIVVHPKEENASLTRLNPWISLLRERQRLGLSVGFLWSAAVSELPLLEKLQVQLRKRTQTQCLQAHLISLKLLARKKHLVSDQFIKNPFYLKLDSLLEDPFIHTLRTLKTYQGIYLDFKRPISLKKLQKQLKSFQ